MADQLITDRKVKRALEGHSSHMGAGPDGLFPLALKALSSHTSSVFARMFNLSLQTGQAPEDWRRAIATPDPRPFRPISLTSVACKILGTILKEELLSHLSQLSLLIIRQNGFFPHRPIVTNLLATEETVTRGLDEGETVDIAWIPSKHLTQ